MKFAVAYMNAFDNDLQITVVEAVDCIKGIIEGARVLMKADDADDWLADLYNTAVDTTDNLDSAIEFIQVEFFNCDLHIAIKVL